MLETAQKLVTVNCRLCGGGDLFFLFDSYDRDIGKQEKFQLVQCRLCKLVFLNPRPVFEMFHRYYDAERYYPYQMAPQAPSAGQIAVKEKPKSGLKKAACDPANPIGYFYLSYLAQTKGDFHRIKKVVPSQTRLLDIGCGAGQFLLSALRYGWRVQGVEMMEQACRKAKELGLSVFQGTLQQARFPDKSFDLVRLSHVFEHLPDPGASLVEIRRVLSDGGKVLITVPNFGGVIARIFGKSWWCVDSPRHLYLYTPKTLRRIAEKAGFKIIFQRTATGNDGILACLEYWMERRKRPGSGGTKFQFHSEKFRRFIQRITPMVCWGFDCVGLGDGLEMTLQKE
ncbi:MAG: class I SAM-dependent methyltransferase [Candidatus Omnitrophica bacterium]|nr:class I SAM-dependent methyltransferase [Candidatus Omnitrophota bacterium]